MRVEMGTEYKRKRMSNRAKLSELNNSEKNKILKRSQKNEKKFFSIAAPTVNLRNRGRGCTSQNVGRIYSTGKYPDFALCVRTQIDFYLKGGITAHSDNKTRLNRFICVHIGHYTHKRNRNTAKNE